MIATALNVSTPPAPINPRTDQSVVDEAIKTLREYVHDHPGANLEETQAYAAYATAVTKELRDRILQVPLYDESLESALLEESQEIAARNHFPSNDLFNEYKLTEADKTLYRAIASCF